MIKELKQLSFGVVPGKPVVIQIESDTLSEQDKNKLLVSVNIIEEKIDGRVEGLTNANRSKKGVSERI